jgi:diguanylate cyclase (GGDEF)-like protein/PAS domain S-box-containing protein
MDRGWWVVGCAAVYVALFVLWTHFHWGGEACRTLIANAVPPPLQLLMTVMCWRTSRHPALTPRSRWGWRSLTAAAVCYLIVDSVLWPYHELVLGRSPLESLDRLFFVACYPLAALGLALLTERLSGRAERFMFGLDAGIMLIGVSAAIWYLWQMSAVPTDRGLRAAEALVFVVPAVALFFLWMAMAVSFRGLRPDNANPLQWLVLAILTYCTGDLLFESAMQRDGYLTGDLIDGLYAIADWLVIVGAQLEHARLSVCGSTAQRRRPSELFKVLPYLAVVLAYGLLLSSVRDDWREPLGGLIFAAAILTALLLVRQFVASRENLRLRAEQNQRESEARFAALVRGSSDLVTITDPYGLIQFISPAVRNLLGHEPDALQQTPLLALLHPEDQHRGRDFFRDALRDPGVTAMIEWRMRRQDSSWVHVETVASNLRDDRHVRGIVLNSRDISERRALEEQLRHLAFYDALTRLANRVLFRDRVEHALDRARRSGQPVALMFLDLDNFKAVNDSLGHAEGDRLLLTTARQLTRHTRASDTVARLGGDEFAILIEEVPPPDNLKQLADRIVEALRIPYRLERGEVLVTASMGIVIGSGAESADELMRDADTAMYVAKGRGKHRYEIFDVQMRSATRDRPQLEKDLRRALEREGELSLHYQPIMDLATGRISGIEALARWRHPTLDSIPPATFIPIAEQSGLIVPLGNWVLREAFGQARLWRDKSSNGQQPYIAVNVSTHQLQQVDFPANVARELERSGVAPDAVVLEFTESVMMRNTPVALDRLRELDDLGVRLAIDDFGTGFSSLSYLHRFPIHLLKIDRSFIEHLDNGGEGAALARAIIAMGDTLQIKMVAEGIEGEGQLRELRRLGCHLGQGYLFSKPTTVQEFAWSAGEA